MSSRLERLAAAALQGLCASPRHAPHADPHTGDPSPVAKRALALGRALDDELGLETFEVDTSSTVTEDDVRRIIGEVFAEDAARPAAVAKRKS